MRTLFTTRFTHLDDDLLLAEMKERIAAKKQTSCYYANFSQVMLNEESDIFRQDFGYADIVVPDGIALAIAGRLLDGSPLRLKTVNNTTDLFDRILVLAGKEGYPVFFLGGTADGARMLRDRLLQNFPDLIIAGIHHGHFGDASPAVIEAINASGAAIVMVGLGSPLQERWLAQHRAELTSPFVMTAGAYISFLSNEIPRAPSVFRKMRLEWLYRLCQEPGRLWRRYIVGGALFCRMVFQAWLRRK